MKKTIYVITITLALLHSMTAIIGWPGGDAYSLVLKPYPSLTKEIPHMEDGDWKRAVISGDIPAWVVGKQYIELAASGSEVQAPLIVRIYSISLVLLILFAPVAVLLMLLGFRKKQIRKHLPHAV